MIRSILERLWYERDPGIGQRVLGGILAPLSLAYRAGLSLSPDSAEPQSVGRPVISVGNLTVGGSGKTPLTIELAARLWGRGRRVAVLSRGYGRKTGGSMAAGGPDSVRSAGEIGDEPRLIALRCPFAHVVVGEDRIEAGKLAVSRFAPDVILCDDAFQHRRLKRDVDVLAIHATRGFGNGFLLPRGPLREPTSALQRAQLVVFTHAGQIPLGELRRRHGVPASVPAAALQFAPGGLRRGSGLEPALLPPGSRVVAASGIADGSGFVETCRLAGFEIVQTLVFPDHHFFSPRDIRRMEEAGRTSRAQAILMTEKDLVRVTGEADCPLLGLRIQARFLDEESEQAVESILGSV